MSASGIIALVVAIAVVQGQQPTSFTFDGIRYTFYPGEIARTWAEANGFCKSLGKELAVFASRAQVRNVSEYLSPDGGVWTGYKTNADCKFESAELADFEWKKEFGTALAVNAKAKQCGLLSVANYTGIVPTDCTTKKAALCSLSNPDAVEAEAIRDSKALPKSSEKASNGTAARPPAPLTKSAGATTAVKPTKDEKEGDDADAKAKGAKAASGTSKAAAKPASEKKKSSSDDEVAADSDANKPPAEVVKKPASEAKQSSEKKTPVSRPSSAEETKQSASETKPSSESKKAPAEAKKAGGSDAKASATDGKKAGGGDAKPSAADAKKSSSDTNKGDGAPTAKPKSKTAAAPKKDADADTAAVAEDVADEEATPAPTTRPPTNQLPIQIESGGGRFTFFPNHIMFGGYMEYSRFCEDKGLQPAVFASRSQLDDVASHVNSVVMVWTGYSTDSQGNVHSVDETSAAWQPDYEIGEGGTATMPSLMCGALSTSANKIGVTMNSCASAHEALCSAKSFSKKQSKK